MSRTGEVVGAKARSIALRWDDGRTEVVQTSPAVAGIFRAMLAARDEEEERS